MRTTRQYTRRQIEVGIYGGIAALAMFWGWAMIALDIARRLNLLPR